MKKLRKSVISILAFAILCTACRSGVAAPSLDRTPVLHQDYLKSVHYSGDGWAVNFWNCEPDQIDAQLDRIVADGFNSIILVLPCLLMLLDPLINRKLRKEEKRGQTLSQPVAEA